MKSKNEDESQGTSPDYHARRLLPALALLMTLLVGVERADAICTPAAPVNDSVVTCTGTTTDQNAPNGYGTGNETGITINVETGATVRGTTADGLRFFQGTVNNGGTILAGNIGIGTDNVSVTNTGVIRADAVGIAANTGSVANLGGEITAAGTGILFQRQGTVFNTGQITGRTTGIEAAFLSGTAEIMNAGGIRATVTNSIAIDTHNNTAIIDNASSGIIAADKFGIDAATADVRNAGRIEATGLNGIAIQAATTATVDNSGTILGGATGAASGINATTAIVTNSGYISAGDFGIRATNAATVVNSGTIVGQVTSGINSDNVAVSNSGTISGGTRGVGALNATVSNSGTISAAGGTAIQANDAADVSNSGTISGTVGISGFNPSSITNSGAIVGTGGTAIRLGPGADTLTLLQGSHIVGAIDMGGGADTINLVNNVSLVSRVSSFFRFVTVNALNLINFTGTLNTVNTINNPNGIPTVQTADGVATLDPTALGQADRTLMDFTGGVASLVQGRLGGAAANVSGMQVVSFAPTHASGRTNEAFAAISSGMAYGAEGGRPIGKAPASGFAPYAAPYTVWASGFGGARTQRADNLMLRSTSSAWGGVIGVDRRVRSDLLLGAFAGGGTGRLSVDLSSQNVDTDYIVGGLYGRFEWAAYFLDVTLQAGGIHNNSTRLVLNNLAPGGSETATASYNGWYVSPDAAFGLRYAFGDGYTVTPVARLRYLAGVLDGYSEIGSVQNLSVGRRTLQDLEERAEIELSKITGVSAGVFKTDVHGGVIALQRLGSPTINTVLIGQDLSFTTPGEASAVGVVAGAGIDIRASANMTLFGAFEGTVMSDNSRTIAAKGGLRVVF